MPSFQEIEIMGHVGNAPGLRYAANGTALLNFSVAVSDNKKQADGTWAEDTTWFKVTVFGEQAERIAPRIEKGAMVAVWGRVKIDSYRAKDGAERNDLAVTANRVLSFASKGAAPTQTRRPAPAATNDDLPF